MNEFSYINFNSFTTSQICDLIVERIYKSVCDILDNTYCYIGDQLFIRDSNHTFFNTNFLLLVDEIKHLMRLEAKIVFPYIKEEGKHRPQNQSPNVIIQRQKNIIKLLLETRIAFLQLQIGLENSTEKQIIENDLFHLESIIKEWFLIVNQKLLNT